ncbi:MAG: hypothetical protein QG628_345 [Patescibacteria group bacterium]|jgi:hypothetical protein|nr:hypothetical protein [Patescibacteria group bacterium]
MIEKDDFTLSDSDRKKFDAMVAEEYPPAEITDGYDPTPRDVAVELSTDSNALPLGHIAFQGDFDSEV